MHGGLSSEMMDPQVDLRAKINAMQRPKPELPPRLVVLGFEPENVAGRPFSFCVPGPQTFQTLDSCATYCGPTHPRLDDLSSLDMRSLNGT